MMTPEHLAEIRERVLDSIEDEFVCCSAHVVWDRAELLAEVDRLRAQVAWGRAFRMGDGVLFVDEDEMAFIDESDVRHYVRPEHPESPYDLVVRQYRSDWEVVTPAAGGTPASGRGPTAHNHERKAQP